MAMSERKWFTRLLDAIRSFIGPLRTRIGGRRPFLSPTLRIVILLFACLLVVAVMFILLQKAYGNMSPLQLRLISHARWVVLALAALLTVFVLYESKRSGSARTVGIISGLIITLGVATIGLEPPPSISISDLQMLKEFNASFDGVQFTPDLEEIARAVELAKETDPLRLAQSKLARGKLEEAVTLFDRALTEMDEMERVIGETHFYKAVALSNLGLEEEAITEADIAHAILPQRSLASFMKCRSLRRLHRVEEALSFCERAIQEDPLSGWAWGEKGAVLIEMGTQEMNRKPELFEDGIAASNICIELLPNHPSPWNNKAVAYRRLGRLPEAIESADRALALKPDFADALLSKGSALRHMGKLDEAAAIYREMTKNYPFDPEAWNNLGDIFEQRGDYVEALHYYSAAAQQRDNFSDAWYNKGHMLNLLGRHSEAIGSLSRAVELNDRDYEAFYQRAIAYIQLGRREEGVEDLGRALAINPDFGDARNLLAEAQRQA